MSLCMYYMTIKKDMGGQTIIINCLWERGGEKGSSKV